MARHRPERIQHARILDPPLDQMPLHHPLPTPHVRIARIPLDLFRRPALLGLRPTPAPATPWQMITPVSTASAAKRRSFI